MHVFNSTSYVLALEVDALSPDLQPAVASFAGELTSQSLYLRSNHNTKEIQYMCMSQVTPSFDLDYLPSGLPKVSG